MASSRKFAALGVLVTLAFGVSAPDAIAKGKGGCAALTKLDTDHDGKLELGEAKQAATALFDKLDKDKDGTLTTKELQGRLSKKDLAANDPDKDKTLSKDEYLAIIDKRFTAADTDKDGSIDCKESQSIAGHALMRLLK